jgi:hypothetical protein
MFVIHVDTIKKQHVKMHIEIDRTTESLDECDGTGMSCDFGVTVVIRRQDTMVITSRNNNSLRANDSASVWTIQGLYDCYPGIK